MLRRRLARPLRGAIHTWGAHTFNGSAFNNGRSVQQQNRVCLFVFSWLTLGQQLAAAGRHHGAVPGGGLAVRTRRQLDVVAAVPARRREGERGTVRKGGAAGTYIHTRAQTSWGLTQTPAHVHFQRTHTQMKLVFTCGADKRPLTLPPPSPFPQSTEECQRQRVPLCLWD